MSDFQKEAPLNPPQEGGYIVEFIKLGSALKVTAIDEVTLREVSIVGDPKMTRKHLSKVAIAKLRYVLEKEKKAHE
jgi:hypothetical protein